MSNKCELFIAKPKNYDECAGCGKSFGPNESKLSGITSCCRQCYVDLCFECVAEAFRLITEVNTSGG